MYVLSVRSASIIYLQIPCSNRRAQTRRIPDQTRPIAFSMENYENDNIRGSLEIYKRWHTLRLEILESSRICNSGSRFFGSELHLLVS